MASPFNQIRASMLPVPLSPQTLSMDVSSPARAGVQAWDVTNPTGAAVALGPPLAQTARPGRQVRIEAAAPLGQASARLAKLEAKNAAATAKLEKQLAKTRDAQLQFRMAHRILDWSAADDPTAGSHGMQSARPWLGFYHHEDVVLNA